MFMGCKKLVDICLPNGISIIKDSAFDRCTALTHVTIPASIIRIAPTAFSDCSNLRNITFGGTVEQWNELVKKDDYWMKKIPLTKVICSDGVISLNG